MTTFPTRLTGTLADRPLFGGRPVSTWAFLGVAVTSGRGAFAIYGLWSAIRNVGS